MERKIIVNANSNSFEAYAQLPLIVGDVNAYKIVFTAPYNLDGATFVVSAKRADGVVVADIGSIVTENDKTAAVYTLKNNMYAISGMLELDLQLNKDGGVLTDCRLLCDVCEGHAIADMAGDDRLLILTELINKTTVAADIAQNAAAAATEAVDNASQMHADLGMHLDNKDNPHGVTTAQIGAATAQDLWAERTAREAADDVLTGQLGGKEPAITAGRVDQYYRGDKVMSSFLDAVQRSRISYLDVPPYGTEISKTDDVVAAFGKLQAQIREKTGDVVKTVPLDSIDMINEAGIYSVYSSYQNDWIDYSILVVNKINNNLPNKYEQIHYTDNGSIRTRRGWVSSLVPPGAPYESEWGEWKFLLDVPKLNWMGSRVDSLQSQIYQIQHITNKILVTSPKGMDDPFAGFNLVLDYDDREWTHKYSFMLDSITTADPTGKIGEVHHQIHYMSDGTVRQRDGSCIDGTDEEGGHIRIWTWGEWEVVSGTSGNIVFCDGDNDNLKIQAAIDAAPTDEKTRINIHGTAHIEQTIGSIGDYNYYIYIPQNKDILLDFSECAKVSADCIYLTCNVNHVVFYQEGNLELRGLNMNMSVREAIHGNLGKNWFVYNTTALPADIKLIRCSYSVTCDGIDDVATRMGIFTHGNVYIHDSEIITSGYYGSILTMNGNNKNAIINGSVLSTTSMDDVVVQISGENATASILNSKIERIRASSGASTIFAGISNLLYIDSSNIIGSVDYSDSGTARIFNGEIKNCSISTTTGNAIDICPNGTKGGASIVNNILYNNGTINNIAGTNTLISNNVSTAKAYPTL